jgi:hypothetical protein
MESKILRPGDQTRWIEAPERPQPKPETAEMIPDDWIRSYDAMTSTQAKVIYDYDPNFRRRVDLLLAQRSQRGY